MIVDILLILAALGAVVMGFGRGFLQSVFTIIGYIGGGVIGLWLGLTFAPKIHFNKFIIILIAIFLFAEIGGRILGSLAASFRARLLWPPLRLLDSIAGVALELIRVAIFAYFIIALALMSPWQPVRHSIAQSKIYPVMKKEMPRAFDKLRVDVEKRFRAIPRL